MRAAAPLLAVTTLALVGAAAWAAPSGGGQSAAALSRRADALDAAATATGDPARRARLQRDAVTARVAAAEAQIAVAERRRATLGEALATQRARLAAQQGPVMRLVAALVSLGRRPAIVALAQPGSIDDLVHVEAALSATLPAARARTAAIRDDLARTRALQVSAGEAASALARGRARLLDASETLQALTDTGDDDARALATGESARDTVAALADIAGRQQTLATLAALPAPPAPRAIAPGAGVYRLPVTGALTTGLGELSPNGVKARGLTFAVAPGAAVIAPAAGRVAYARPFRGFGGIVILDHGDGWSTLVTGLGRFAVRGGQQVAAGAPLGNAGDGDEASVTVELRRRGRPVDMTPLLR